MSSASTDTSLHKLLTAVCVSSDILAAPYNSEGAGEA
jgi:hypothetical protein